MIATVAARAGTHSCQWPAGCAVNIPYGRSLCYFHVKPELEVRYEHVLGHLRERDRPLLPYFLMAYNMPEVAYAMGPGWTQRVVELSWPHVVERMKVPGGILGRVALLRIVAGYDACWCGL